MTNLSACCIENFIQHLYCWIQLEKMLDITCGKSGYSSALLNVNLTFQLLVLLVWNRIYSFANNINFNALIFP